MLYVTNLLSKVYEFVKIRAMTVGNSSTPVRISAFYAASFVSFGVHLPFFPLLMAGRGLDAAEIAFVTTVPIVLRITTASFAGSFADLIGDRRRALLLYCGIAFLGVLAIGPAQSFAALVAASALLAVAWNGVLPVSDAIATNAVRRGEAVYGRMRVWGSLSFVATNLVAGRIVAAGGPETVWWLLVAAFGLQLLAVAVLPDERAGNEARGRREGMIAGLRAVANDRRLMAILIGIGILQASHAMLYGFSSLHWARLGFGGDWIGVLWAIGVIGEIALFTFSGAVLERVSARALVLGGAVGAVVRWCLFPFVGADPALWVGVQLLHAASFAAVHLGTMALITRAVADHRAATAQGVCVSLTGVAMSAATIASGPLYGAFGGTAFLAMAATAALGAGIFAVASLGEMRRDGAQPQSAGLGGKTRDPS